MPRHRLLVIVLALTVAAVSTAPAAGYSRPATADERRGLGPTETAPPTSIDTGSDVDDPQFADQVINDDLIIFNSACIGFDCVNNENFGADTIRLKENNLRIAFVDTSTTSGFPSNDWELTANDSQNGGLNHFSITDVTGGRVPFRVEAGARTDALYVEADGDVGIGTNNPALDLHIVSTDTPATRLEQDGSGGFGAQTWDVAGNETNFFIRDITNGALLPFRIRPGAPTSSIDIAANGDVGIGTSTPDHRLDIEAADGVSLGLTSTNGDDWQLSTASSGAADEGLSISRAGSGQDGLRITPSGATVWPDNGQPADPVPGTTYFDGDTFCGFDGTEWRPLQADGDMTCD